MGCRIGTATVVAARVTQLKEDGTVPDYATPLRDVYLETAVRACWDHMLGLLARRLPECMIVRTLRNHMSQECCSAWRVDSLGINFDQWVTAPIGAKPTRRATS